MWRFWIGFITSRVWASMDDDFSHNLPSSSPDPGLFSSCGRHCGWYGSRYRRCGVAGVRAVPLEGRVGRIGCGTSRVLAIIVTWNISAFRTIYNNKPVKELKSSYYKLIINEYINNFHVYDFYNDNNKAIIYVNSTCPNFRTYFFYTDLLIKDFKFLRIENKCGRAKVLVLCKKIINVCSMCIMDFLCV